MIFLLKKNKKDNGSEASNFSSIDQLISCWRVRALATVTVRNIPKKKEEKKRKYWCKKRLDLNVKTLLLEYMLESGHGDINSGLSFLLFCQILFFKILIKLSLTNQFFFVCPTSKLLPPKCPPNI